MSTQEETQDKQILPLLDSEKTLPTQIHEVDEKIEWLKSELANIQKQISEAQLDRTMLIKRAKEVVCLDDGNYKIVDIPIYPNKRVDVERLRAIAPEKYEQILSNIRSRLQDEIAAKQDKAGSFVSQSDVKAVIKDKGIIAQVIPEPSAPERWEVSVVKR
jgi:hypothetical protein